MTAPLCVRCERPTPDGYACSTCASELAGALREASGHAEDAETVIARQTRYGSGGRGGSVVADPFESEIDEDPRRNPVTVFGWAASIERPAAGALRPGAFPANLAASRAYAVAENVITTWARHVDEEGGGELPARPPIAGPVCEHECGHVTCRAIQRPPAPIGLGVITRWLARQIGWLRTRPEVREAFDELHDACSILVRLVDSPAGGDRLVGMCDCGRILYAPHGRDVVQCRASNCGAKWNVTESQQILRDALDQRLVTAAEAAHLGAYLDTDRSVKQIRRMVAMWVLRGRLAVCGTVPGLPDKDGLPTRLPTYRFGDIASLMAGATRRTARVDVA